MPGKDPRAESRCRFGKRPPFGVVRGLVIDVNVIRKHRRAVVTDLNCNHHGCLLVDVGAGGRIRTSIVGAVRHPGLNYT